MHKVWEELKSIEAQAKQIQNNAKQKTQQITQQAQKDAQTLLKNSKTYAAEESKKRYDAALAEANQLRQNRLDETDRDAKKLKAQAQTRMSKAVDIIVDAVLEENL